jgi:hypothetical protein
VACSRSKTVDFWAEQPQFACFDVQAKPPKEDIRYNYRLVIDRCKREMKISSASGTRGSRAEIPLTTASTGLP